MIQKQCLSEIKYTERSYKENFKGYSKVPKVRGFVNVLSVVSLILITGLFGEINLRYFQTNLKNTYPVFVDNSVNPNILLFKTG